MVVLDSWWKTMPQVWQRFVEHLRSNPEIMSEQSFQTWIEPLTFLRRDNGTCHLLAPDKYFAQWFQDHFSTNLEQTYAEVIGEPILLDLAYPSKAIEASAPRPNLNPNFTFDRFVEGKANREASSAARSVADKPAKAFNPLYLYGEIGLGKTHLLQAIGHHLCQHKPGLVVRFISGEQYVNEYVRASRHSGNEKLEEFRVQFRRDCDVLLIDDVPFLSGKKKSQEEFFHTFNDLYNAGKQIILTGNQQPDDIPELSEKLRSRLMWNLVVEIKAPELPLRMAILKAKARRMDLKLNDEVARFIAERIDSNVRQLEGALANLHFRCHFESAEPSEEIAAAVLKDLFKVAEKPDITPQMIEKVVCKMTGLGAPQLKSGSREPNLVTARQLLFYLCREHTELSAPKLAQAFGVGSHATVLNAYKKVKKGLSTDANVRQRVEQAEALIEQARRLA